MSSKRPLDLVLVWHMHQPDYRDYATGEFTRPWVYLHAIKDYTDMAGLLERCPGVSAVINLAPVLLDQLEDYTDQFATGQLRDPLLKLLARDGERPLSAAERAVIFDQCFHANRDHMITAFPMYKSLHDLFVRLESQGQAALAYLSDQYLYDLLTWYHLTWLGETVRRASDTFPTLVAVGGGFTHAHRSELLRLIGSEVAGVIPRYRRLAEGGKVELSTTPHYHPLAPLLIDFRSALESLPDAPLPVAKEYPGGAVRVGMHIEGAMASHARRFGTRPAGLWPAEGAVSEAVLRQIAQRGFKWTASSESVLANTIRRREGRPYLRTIDLHRPYRLSGVPGELVCFFRDEHLSDLIGFQYATWRGEDAAAHLVGELEVIAASAPAGERPVVSIILDGENAWEAYPYNGFYFLSALYDQLESHSSIRTHTYQKYLEHRAGPPPPVRVGTEMETPSYAAVGALQGLVAGSWVYGNFATWIGSPDKNRAWDLLVAAKQAYDAAVSGGLLSPVEMEAARRQLADCEGSDWFWWFGDYNAIDAVASFDRLYRLKLSNLYTYLRLPVPAGLREPISRGKLHPEAGGSMRRSS